ncbi:PEP-CTERM-box response regulator transcription factor [Pelagicoccus sp. SDUM812003]|uniref:PEP-CTERM-box response regulator transcription factor n=1 Tax=Pelagicoccus sp. SDUM812003 TaxID=3041267 RepID=UPI00280FF8BB|nr:PEP-CTERM-box response regulator transcription factor [Pelagicoccus sp. SDUM812003]MDQ8205198.1 PEP-CTERM-box response regulator transcription factor [Pelagicoccus sp. SDUM812003]
MASPDKAKLLIVDDDDEIRTQMRWSLSSDYEILQAGNREGALQQFKEHQPSVVLLDLGLPPRPNLTDEGMNTLAEIVQSAPKTKVIIISGQGERENALEAIGRGAYDFLSKPVDTDELQLLLKRCFYVAELERDYVKMQRQLNEDAFEGMLGNSEPMQKVFGLVRKVATSDAPVMVLGESGTGKEMIASAIHKRSSRADGPFVPINCSAIPESLLESELFGHEKGSFTGADSTRIGKIEQAQGGTLFLDEIGEVPLSVQVKLLRFLQEGYIERVGGREAIKVDARIVAATNADLKKGMADGSFREDFYFRLAVVELNVPPLRERGEDIEYLATTFLKRFAAEAGNGNLSFSAAALKSIRSYAWSGNVRELQNRVRRAAIMCDGNRVSPEDLQIPSSNRIPAGTTLKEAREALEKELVEAALAKHKGKITAASAELGISRPTFYELLDRLGIKR